VNGWVPGLAAKSHKVTLNYMQKYVGYFFEIVVIFCGILYNIVSYKKDGSMDGSYTKSESGCCESKEGVLCQDDGCCKDKEFHKEKEST